MGKTKHLVYMSLLTAAALVLGLIETMIPVPLMTPGAKVGLGNLVIVLALYTLDKKRDTAMIIIAKLILGSIYGAGMSGMMYGAVGSLLSFISMSLIKDGMKDKVSMIGVSAVGAVFHNLGQVIVSCMIVKNPGVMLYLPILTVAGLTAGIFIGIAANFIITYLYDPAIYKEKNQQKY